MAFGFDNGPEVFIHDTWGEFKKYINGIYATLAFQFSEDGTHYKIITEPFVLSPQVYDLLKDSGADQIDFETNFKNLAYRNPGKFFLNPVIGQSANGASSAGINPILVAGSDNSNIRTLNTDSSGRQIVVGPAAIDASVIGNPVLIAGSDENNIVRRFLLNANGSVITVSQNSVTPTFVSYIINIPTANNKSMASVANISSTKVVKVVGLKLINVQTNNGINGVIASMELRRMTSHSGGALQNIEVMDTNDVVDAGISVRSGATIVGESTKLITRLLVSTDDFGANAVDAEVSERNQQNYFNYHFNLGKPITLRQNQGMTIKCATNTATGLFDILIEFVQDDI